ncbi:hypothetical protein [Acidithiobacillus thiooxidans]|nr:hypothetical protein [Acidithiobacillus thiooxidans]
MFSNDHIHNIAGSAANLPSQGLKEQIRASTSTRHMVHGLKKNLIPPETYLIQVDSCNKIQCISLHLPDSPGGSMNTEYQRQRRQRLYSTGQRISFAVEVHPETRHALRRLARSNSTSMRATLEKIITEADMKIAMTTEGSHMIDNHHLQCAAERGA